MKGNEAEYMVPLKWLFTQPKPKRTNKAIGVIKAFVKKHTRKTDVLISPELNEFLWERARHVPRRVAVVLRLDGERVTVYLKDGKQLESDKKARKAVEDAKKKKEREDQEKAEKEKAKTAEAKKAEKAAEAAQQKKAEEKREREGAARASEMKRGH
ncbi:MAG TPA: hypothetical protein HA252_06620 [Candidatus Diapherotrites archaeon]|uniref:Large ribosomal subunit protein eL31 n=1 Tax=Candidatus Iainarchaeum sp. TaxID=3101447 RepID=A0A7J4JH26_9ARCH|nr:60S ribosomal protein L31 [Candidatus Diapherotrites archaeon]HIH17051.1 hypothetical protein [Candidatus Diapherotrites archaeon]